MYRCKECNAEYEIKPDYCDCGNDEFELIGTDNNSTVDKKVDAVNVDLDKNMQVNIPPKAEPMPAPQINYNKQQTASVKRLSVDPASLTIFCLCLLLSLYIVFFAWNPKENNIATENTKQETIVSKNIPSVNKIWNDEVPKVTPKKEGIPTPSENLIQQVFPKQTETKQTTAQPQKAVIPQKKATQTSKSTTTVSKATTTQQSKQEQQKNTAKQLAKQKAEQERAAAEAAMIKKLQAEQTKKKAEEKAKQEKAAKEELTNYKANLRNAIGRKVDFTRVIGDGSCTVSFKIDSNGKLINRSFTKQSTNNTLNDEVYAAVMSTPTFNPPPSGYKGETLNLNIGFYNGNFEISLP